MQIWKFDTRGDVAAEIVMWWTNLKDGAIKNNIQLVPVDGQHQDIIVDRDNGDWVGWWEIKKEDLHATLLGKYQSKNDTKPHSLIPQLKDHYVKPVIGGEPVDYIGLYCVDGENMPKKYSYTAMDYRMVTSIRDQFPNIHLHFYGCIESLLDKIYKIVENPPEKTDLNDQDYENYTEMVDPTARMLRNQPGMTMGRITELQDLILKENLPWSMAGIAEFMKNHAQKFPMEAFWEKWKQTYNNNTNPKTLKIKIKKPRKKAQTGVQSPENPSPTQKV